MASCLHNKCKEWAECCLRYDDGTHNNSALKQEVSEIVSLPCLYNVVK